MDKRDNRLLIDAKDKLNWSLKGIANKVLGGERISKSDALELYKNADLSLLSLLSSHIRRKINGNVSYYNRNFHLEPTNICINHCRFCSYRRQKGEAGAWSCSIKELMNKFRENNVPGTTEVHIVGGVHPDRDINYYVDLVRAIRTESETIHIKAFTAVEIDQVCKISNISVKKGLLALKKAGLQSMPGGGAEIFDEQLRHKIAPDKTSSERWIEIHKTAHQCGIPTNATMLYGLLEKPIHRVDHMDRLRNLQDETDGFNVFIPLKFRNSNNEFSNIEELPVTEDLRNYAVSRIFLDNIPHIKAYWPMIGKGTAQASLAYGVDDLDGTIKDTTKIYTMAGAEEKSPAMSEKQIITMIHDAGFDAAERDTLFNVIKNLPKKSD